ncbi:beta-galactosidase trimerization domain-containing protein [candidate division KSB1 bacterium]|nr:beta-galactosidase trimerization domain-containing protein [candidate division KSB1 bacterium]
MKIQELKLHKAIPRFRQVHLDFHTSEHIPGVGSEFDPDEFAETLKNAHVNSINLFARGHHGYIYYNTLKFPERRHPHLTCNLLKDQIDACHARDIRTPIYITVQWDHFTALRHPEWLVVNEFGAPVTSATSGQTSSIYEPGFYHFLCLNSPYLEFLKALTLEVLETLPCDGTWFDIVQATDCSCQYCRAGMLAEGLDPANRAHRLMYGRSVLHQFKQMMTGLVRKYHRDCVIFYNAGHIGPGIKDSLNTYSQLELESLPSGGWGYLHFPVTVRYARTLGPDCVGMTGKFHTSWGDFHSFKNRAALEFECFQMLSLNAKCSIGDQLHPNGKICKHTYELIGSVYSQVAQKEAWCVDAEPVVEIAALTPEEFIDTSQGSSLPKPIMGLTRMLQEGRYQFDIIDSDHDFSRYRLLILPDEIPLSPALAHKIEVYLTGGGAIIASHHSGLNPEKTAFASDLFGISLKGDAPFNPDFLLPDEIIGQGLNHTEYVMYLRGLEIEAWDDSEILAQTILPYFNRTYMHFCSHRHTPSSGIAGYPGIVRNKRVIYFAHPVFAQYQACSPPWCKRLVLNALALLLPDPLVQVEEPSSIIATLNEQRNLKRYVLHLLHYIPERRNDAFDVIEDVIPLFNLNLSVKAAHKIREIYCAPQMTPIRFVEKNDRVEFSLPELNGHQMVVLAYDH